MQIWQLKKGSDDLSSTRSPGPYCNCFQMNLKIRCFEEMELFFPMPGYPDAFAIASGSGHISPGMARPIDPRSRENLGIWVGFLHPF